MTHPERRAPPLDAFSPVAIVGVVVRRSTFMSENLIVLGDRGLSSMVYEHILALAEPLFEQARRQRSHIATVEDVLARQAFPHGRRHGCSARSSRVASASSSPARVAVAIATALPKCQVDPRRSSPWAYTMACACARMPPGGRQRRVQAHVASSCDSDVSGGLPHAPAPPPRERTPGACAVQRRRRRRRRRRGSASQLVRLQACRSER